MRAWGNMNTTRTATFNTDPAMTGSGHDRTSDRMLDLDDGSGIIPFADEVHGTGEAVEVSGDSVCDAHDLGESAIEEFGSSNETIKRISTVDRDLGLNPKERLSSKGRFECPCCGDGARRVMRVRVVSQPRWVAVCAVCAAAMLARVPGTIVGGMVRPSRRKRSTETRQGQRSNQQAIKQTNQQDSRRANGGRGTPRGFRPGASGGYRQAG